MNHEDVFLRIPAYAIRGLDLDEEAPVEEHLIECDICRTELAAYMEVSTALALSVPDAPLPEGARQRLLERARFVGTESTTPPPVAPPAAAHTSRRSWLPWALVAACLLLSLGLGGQVWRLNAQAIQLAADAAEFKALAGEKQATIDGVVNLMERADLEVVTLGPAQSGARTRIYAAQEDDVAMVVFDRLPKLPEGQVYELWVQTGGKVESVGTFTPTDIAKGSYHKLLKPAQGLQSYERIGVAPAPPGGGGTPPSDWTLLHDIF